MYRPRPSRLQHIYWTCSAAYVWKGMEEQARRGTGQDQLQPIGTCQNLLVPERRLHPKIGAIMRVYSQGWG